MNTKEEIKALANEVSKHLSWIQEEGIDFWKQSVRTDTPPDHTVAPQKITLEEILSGMGECQRCKLSETRTNIVFGAGDAEADLLFIGEGPGADEDQQGLPFVGRAGQLLTKMIAAMGLSRDKVYIANIIKCRPPRNRNPQTDEISTCRPFLDQQIAAIHPKVICALGTFAAQTLLSSQVRISDLRGRFHDLNGVKVLPTFHPAYLLRNPGEKKRVWEDLQVIMEELNLPGPEEK